MESIKITAKHQTRSLVIISEITTGKNEEPLYTTKIYRWTPKEMARSDRADSRIEFLTTPWSIFVSVT